MRLSVELDRAWSEALEKVDAVEPGEELRVRWSVALQALTAAVGEREERYVAAGKDVRLDHWPPTLEEIVGLETAPREPERGRIQLEQAQILALQLLVQSMGKFTSAMGESGERTEQGALWESGAFAVIRDHGALAMRITREMEAVDATEVDAPAIPGSELMRARAVEALGAARRALQRSDPEGTLLHCIRAARARVASFSPEGRSSVDLSALPVHSTSPLPVKMLGLAEQVVRGDLAGGTDNAGVSVVLAHALLPAVEGLVLNPPVEDLLALLRDCPAAEEDEQ
jgi:hypothetical protein